MTDCVKCETGSLHGDVVVERPNPGSDFDDFVLVRMPVEDAQELEGILAAEVRAGSDDGGAATVLFALNEVGVR